MGENRFLRRSLQSLDLRRSECMKRGTGLHCTSAGSCDQGWQCVPAKDVDPKEWVGTYCFDPACPSDTTNRVDDQQI